MAPKIWLGFIAIFTVLTFAAAQNTTTNEFSNTTALESTTDGPTPENTTELTTGPTTVPFIPEYKYDPTLPAPKELAKKRATNTSLTLSFRPPRNYRNDARYSHFRIDYTTATGRNETVELDKDVVFPSNVILPGLRSGVLYEIIVRSQGQDSFGNYLLSRSNGAIVARTMPPSVFNLRIVPLGDSLTSVTVVWDGSPTPFNGPQYNAFVLSMEITDPLTSTQAYRFRRLPVEIPHQTSILEAAPPRNISREVSSLVLGATYRFSVVTKSSIGGDPTVSLAKSYIYRVKVPGPLNLTKLSHNASSITIGWDIHRDVTGITNHVLYYRPIADGIGDKSNEVVLPAGTRQYQFVDLDPGVLYQVAIRCLRSEEPFGNETDEATVYARTSPALPGNVTIDDVTMSSVLLRIVLPENVTATSISIQHEDLATGEKSDPEIFRAEERNITVLGLSSGALYEFSVTISSQEGLPVDETSSTTQILGRTIPSAPKALTGTGTQGKIILSWRKPDELNPPTRWRYEIVYYPSEKPDQISRLSIWNRAGASKMTHSLDRLLPGTLYEVMVYCEVGEEAERDRVRRSAAAGPLSLYTQPKNPVITGWKQVTLTQVRIEWSAPGNSISNFDYYSLNLTRIYRKNSAIEFKPEVISMDIDKHKRREVLKLTPGATYRIVLTSVVGSGPTWMQSVVNSSNSKVYDTWSPYDSHQVFARLIWRFTDCGQFGRFGPNQILCDDIYKESSLGGLVQVEEGIQHWIAPIEGLYRITAKGAGYQGPGGKGATVSGLFHLKEGAKLKIAVGQQGDYSYDMTQGGAGGTFVVADDDEDVNEPMVIAGGAGTAAPRMAPLNITHGRLNHTAGDASSVGQGFGYGGKAQTLGPGLPGTSNTMGGAGFRGLSKTTVRLGDAVSPAVGFIPYLKGESMNETELSLYVPLAGGRYVTEDGEYSEGGFGGGGSGYMSGAGGGGGYTGGGGGPLGGYSGGGGSYIKFTGGNQYAEVTNNGPGGVEISLVGLPVSSPVPVTLYLVVAFFVGVGATLCCGGMLIGVDKCVGRYMGEKAPENTPTKDPPAYVIGSPRSLNTSYFETSVHVTSDSPSTSGLYVRNVNEDANSYRKYSEVDSEDMVPHPRKRAPIVDTIPEDEGPVEIVKSKSPNRRGKIYVNGVLYDDSADEEEYDDAKTESSASPIESLGSEFKVAEDTFVWDIENAVHHEEHEDSSDSASEEDDEEEDEESDYSDKGSQLSSLPPPPPPPPLEELMTEELREKFRQNQGKFQELENQG